MSEEQDYTQSDVRLAALERVVTDHSRQIKNLHLALAEQTTAWAMAQMLMRDVHCTAMLNFNKVLLLILERIEERAPGYEIGEIRKKLESMGREFKEMQNSPNPTMHYVEQMEGFIASMKKKGFIQEDQEPPGIEPEQG